MKSHKINQQVQHINKLQKTMMGSCNVDLNILFVVPHDDLFRLLIVVFLSLFLFCTCSEAPMKSSACLGSSKAECVGQGSLLFTKFEFSIKPDLRGLSFS